MPISSANERLKTALKFTQEDLEANRTGRMSARQRDARKPPPVASIAQWVILGHFVLLVGVLGAIALVANRPILWGILLGVAGLAALPFIATRNEFVMRPVLQSDLAQGRVARACGVVLFQLQGGSTRLLVAGEAFSVSTKVSAAFVQGQSYCLYYLPQSKVILSAEQHEG